MYFFFDRFKISNRLEEILIRELESHANDDNRIKVSMYGRRGAGEP